MYWQYLGEVEALLGMVEGMRLGRVEDMDVVVAVFGWGTGWNINKGQA